MLILYYETTNYTIGQDPISMIQYNVTIITCTWKNVRIRVYNYILHSVVYQFNGISNRISC